MCRTNADSLRSCLCFQVFQLNSFLNHNRTASLCFRTYPLKRSGVILFCPELCTVDEPSFVYMYSINTILTHSCQKITGNVT